MRQVSKKAHSLLAFIGYLDVGIELLGELDELCCWSGM